MRLERGRQSRNIEDRRGGRGRKAAVGGGIGALLLALVAMFLGVDPAILTQGVKQVAPVQSSGVGSGGRSPAEDELAKFVSMVLADTEDTWAPIFRSGGQVYREPTLVLFSGSTQSACGFAKAAMGPFYCPADQKVYIDLQFYDDLQNRFGAPGDFAQAYVIAHEIGHHVQTQLGIADKVSRAQRRASKAQANQLQVLMELQADCLAGVWANHANRARSILERGDIEEGLNAAAAIGDDRLQRQSQGYVVPESFTHGSSAQRVHWFKQGLQYGDLQRCDTFAEGAR